MKQLLYGDEPNHSAQKEPKLGFSSGHHQAHSTQHQAMYLQRESGSLVIENQSIPWLDPQPVADLHQRLNPAPPSQIQANTEQTLPEDPL